MTHQILSSAQTVTGAKHRLIWVVCLGLFSLLSDPASVVANPSKSASATRNQVRKSASKKRSHTIKADFRCNLTLRDLRVRRERPNESRWDSIDEPRPDLLVKLFGPNKEYLFTWPIKQDQYQAEFHQAFSWSSCSRYRAMMLVVYDQDEEGKMEIIGELPLRADLIARMPDEGETKIRRLNLSGGSVRLLSVDFEITAQVLKKTK